ncbi:MAG: hypothetical protein WCV82_02360 [Candidatus Paceibacterota bacterium]
MTLDHHDDRKREVLVTIAIGDTFSIKFRKLFCGSLERYAEKNGFELVIIDQPLRRSDKHVAWQKLLIFDHPRVAKYSRALFVDADVYITSHAADPFSFIGDMQWGIVANNPYNLKGLKRTDLELYDGCPANNRPDVLMNTGVFIVSKDIKPMLEMVYDTYPEQRCWENGPLSYHLLNDKRGVELPSGFNTIAACYRTAFGRSLSKILEMYHKNSFIHFAGGPMKTMPALQIIKYIDTHPDSTLTKLIYRFSQEKYDHFTAPMLSLVCRFIGIYDYRVKRRFVLEGHVK